MDIVGFAASLHAVPEGLVEVFEVPLWQAIWYDTSFVLYRAVARVQGTRREVIFDSAGSVYSTTGAI